MFSKLVLAAVVLLVPAMALAVEWAPISPSGTHIEALAASAAQPGRLYAAGAGGVLRSDDGGETWTAIDGPLPDAAASAVAASVTNADVVAVALVGDAIWVSTDGGVNWAAGAQVERVVDMAFDPLDDAHLIALDGDSLVRTTARGTEWTRVGLDSELSSVGFAPRQPAVYVGSTTGLLVSDDGGETWNPVGEDLLWSADRPVIAITAPRDAYSVAGLSAVDGNSAAFRTPDGWRGIMPIFDDSDAAAAVSQAERIAFADTDAGNLSVAVLGGPDGLYGAVNAGAPLNMSNEFYGGGNNWFAVPDGLPPPADGSAYTVTAVAIDPAIERRYYAAVDGTLYAFDGQLGTDLRLGGRGEDGYGKHRSLFTVCCYDDEPDGPRMDLMWSVYNYSAEPATDAMVTVRIGQGVEIRSASMDDGACVVDGPTITCEVPSIPSHRGLSGIADVGLLESGTFEIVAEVVSADHEATPENNVSAITRTVTVETETPDEETQDDETPPEAEAHEEDPAPAEDEAPEGEAPPAEEAPAEDEPAPDNTPAGGTTSSDDENDEAPSAPSTTAGSGGGGAFSVLSIILLAFGALSARDRRRVTLQLRAARPGI